MRRSGNSAEKFVVFTVCVALSGPALEMPFSQHVPAHHLATVPACHFSHMPIAALHRIVAPRCVA